MTTASWDEDDFAFGDEDLGVEVCEAQSTELGCCFPEGSCLMPGIHMKCECHTVEMVEAWRKEFES